MTGLVCGYIGSPPSGRRGSGGCCGQQPGAVVVPTGSGLMTAPPAGPAEAEGEAGAGDPPGGVLPGQAFDAGGLGDGEPDRGDAGRAGLPAPGGDGRVAERDAQVSVADVVLAMVACAGGVSCSVGQRGERGSGWGMIKVLIAGGAGYIGSTVASACLDAGISPVILDSLVTGRREFTAGRAFYEGDIADGPLVDRIFAEHPDIGAVIHCAALIVVPDSVADPVGYYRANVTKSLEFVAHLLRNGCRPADLQLLGRDLPGRGGPERR